MLLVTKLLQVGSFTEPETVGYVAMDAGGYVVVFYGNTRRKR